MSPSDCWEQTHDYYVIQQRCRVDLEELHRQLENPKEEDLALEWACCVMAAPVGLAVASCTANVSGC